jgi:C1A family cysteine protease
VLVASIANFGSAQLTQNLIPTGQCTPAGFTALIERLLNLNSLPQFLIAALSSPLSRDFRQQLYIDRCNAMEASASMYPSMIMETNVFSCMTDAERSNFYSNAIPPTSYATPTSSIREKRQTTALPLTVDYRTKNVLTPVKDQGQCGCCWAYAALGALEPAVAMKTKTTPVSLSEQELVDCSAQECNGGYMDQAYFYIQSKNGMCRTTNYPLYTAKKNTCARNTSSVTTAPVVTWTWVASDELSLQKAVAIRPVTTAIFVAQVLYNYKSGILYEPTCNNAPNDVNHGIVVVGYGTENGVDYWLCRNSWGQTWGDNGYFKLARNRGNNCFIAKYPLYPTV